MGLESETISFDLVWGWFLLFTRMSAVFISLPGVGTVQIPPIFRFSAAATIAACSCSATNYVAIPDSLLGWFSSLALEFSFGFLFGFLPTLIIAALNISGQLVSISIGLGHANLIDPSLGESISVVSRLKTSFGTLLFLFLDGHIGIIEAAIKMADLKELQTIFENGAIIEILADQMKNMFELSATIAAPILVTTVISQFVLGLVTRFVPQVNIFIISLPLTIGLGLYILAYLFEGLVDLLMAQFLDLKELAFWLGGIV